MEKLDDLISYATGGPGVRPDGSQKGSGWLGPMRTSDGRTMTELTAESDIDGQRLMYPLVTPNQGFRNISELLNGLKPSDETYENAIQHALSMKMSGRSPYVYEPFGQSQPTPLTAQEMLVEAIKSRTTK